MTKSSKKSLALIATIAAFLFSNSAFAEPTKVDSKAQATSIKNVESTSDDPDLKLSIEELRKKYPIDWLKKKYGEVSGDSCVTAGEYDINEVNVWPCGTICAKYPKQKKCPDRCYGYKKPELKNLVCSFFKTNYDNLPQNYKDSDVQSKPAARFEDFSANEIKSAFLNYESNTSCSQFKGDCNRIEEIVAIAFIHFLQNSPTEKNDKTLRSFIFSKKLTEKIFTNNHKPSCKSFVDHFIKPSVPSLQSEEFCTQLLTKNK